MKKRDKKHYTILIVLILASVIGNTQDWSWPVSPGNQQKNIVGTLGEFRTWGQNSRFHWGDDITGDNYNVYAISEGIITINYIANDCWNSYVTVGNIRYFHIMPAGGLVSGQTYINNGDFIGTMFTTGGCNYHVHIDCPGINFLHGILIPFTDNTNPTIHDYSFWTNGYVYTNQTTELDDIVSINTADYHLIYNKIDLVHDKNI